MHPSRLFKQVLCEYLRAWAPPGPEGTPPPFGEGSGFVVAHDEEGVTLDGGGPDLLIQETGTALEVAEGFGVWTLSIEISSVIPGDWLPETVRELQDQLWSCLVDSYPGDVGRGMDTPGPLAGRLNALALRLREDDPQAWPRILCVGDVWQASKEPPDLDGPSYRICLMSFQANAEVMPQAFLP